MVDGINISFQYVMELVIYAAITGIAISILIWFVGFVMRSAIGLLNKAMTF